MIYISGQVALDASGNIVGRGDYRAQLQQVFANLKTALEAAGAGFKNVVKLNYYIVDTVDRSECFAYPKCGTSTSIPRIRQWLQLWS